MSTGIVSDVVGFVFANGDDAEELLWHEHKHGEPAPGVTDPEQAALRGALPLVQDAVGGILGAGRLHLIALAAAHRCGDAVRRARPGNLRETRSFRLPVIRGRMEMGMVMEAWGEPRIPIWGWIWVREEDRERMMEAARGVDVEVKQAPNGNLFVSLAEPATGDRFDEVGQRAAVRLWGIARAVAEAF